MMKYKKKIYLALILSLLLVELLLSANICLAQEGEILLPDPFGGRDIPILVGDVIKYALGLVGVIAFIMFIIGGITWMTSGGSSDKIKKGKDTILWAILGLAFIFFSYALLEFILKGLMKSTG